MDEKANKHKIAEIDNNFRLINNNMTLKTQSIMKINQDISDMSINSSHVLPVLWSLNLYVGINRVLLQDHF